MAAAIIAMGAGARQPQRGYRGFLEWSNDLGSLKDGFGRMSTYYVGGSTSHGYQIDSRFFVGAGLAVEECGKIDSYILPVFVQSRADFDFGGFTPFGDLRLGYNLASGAGVYFSPSVGYRFNWGRKMGVNLGVGLTLQGCKTEMFEVDVDPEGYWQLNYLGSKHGCKAFFSFRVGIDF